MPKKRAHGEGSILRRKDGRWQGAVTVGYDSQGKQKRKTVYGKTQAEVREKIEKIKQQVSEGTYSDSKLNIREFLLVHWLPTKANEVKPRTNEFYHYVIKDYIIPCIGKIQLTKLTPIDIQKMMNWVAEQVSNDAANKARRVLYTALEQAVKWQMIPRNPVQAVNRLRVDTKEMKIWSTSEAAQFLDVARGHRLYALFYLAMSTGMRRGELLGLTWQNIQGNVLFVRQTLILVGNKPTFSSPKTKQGHRQIALAEDVLTVLAEHSKNQEAEATYLGDSWQDDKGLVFPSEVGTPLNPRNLERIWYSLQDKAGVTRIRFHDLRHLHASIAIKEGVDPKVLADRLGHSRASFTMDVYTHLFEGQRQAAAVSIMDFLSQPKSSNLPN